MFKASVDKPNNKIIIKPLNSLIQRSFKQGNGHVNIYTSKIIPPPPPVYSLDFDGQNDFVTNDASTPYTEPNKNQAFTFFVNVQVGGLFNVTNVFYTTRAGATGGHVSIVTNPSSRRLQIYLSDGSGVMTVTATPEMTFGYQTLQITYDGSGNASGIKMYKDGILISSSINSDTLSGSIINNAGNVTIGALPGFVINELDGKVRWLSLVDYVKSPSEILSDHNLGIQSIGLGNYLFAVDFNRQTSVNFNSTDAANLAMNILGQAFPGSWLLY